jgi:alpha-amylase
MKDKEITRLKAKLEKLEGAKPEKKPAAKKAPAKKKAEKAAE